MMGAAPSRDSSPAQWAWSDADTEIIRKAAEAGYSAKQAAAMLPGKRSRNAVIGRAFRLGIQFRGKVVLSPDAVIRRKAQCAVNTAIRQAKATAKPAPKTTWRPPVDFRTPGGPVIIYAAPKPIEADLSHARPWLERRRFGQCAYPVSGEGADTLSCCAPTGSVYCEAHHGAVYLPIKSLKDPLGGLARQVYAGTGPASPGEPVLELVEMVA